ncbi:MAG TPA: zinc ribbon domain-containing protein [Tepidisphaeraceae bacterium]|jgi:putative FmdB family regulatory protein
MPLYEFECEECGTFDVFRPLSRAGEAAACPTCAAEASRVWCAPAVAAMSPLQRNAAERNEKSRHDPHVCKTGCGCSGRKKKPAPTNQELDQLGGRTRHVYKGSRPWVLEHQ